MLIFVIIGLVAFVIGFGGGWTIKDWKDGKQIATLESDNSILSASNDECRVDIVNVRDGVALVVKATEDKALAADAAMKSAEALATKHSSAAATIRRAPLVPVDQQCVVIEREQKDYVQSRRD